MTGASTEGPSESLAALAGICTGNYTIPGTALSTWFVTAADCGVVAHTCRRKLIGPVCAVEVCLKANSPLKFEDAEVLIQRVVQTNSAWFRTVGVLSLSDAPDELHAQVSQHIEEIRICPTGNHLLSDSALSAHCQASWLQPPDVNR